MGNQPSRPPVMIMLELRTNGTAIGSRSLASIPRPSSLELLREACARRWSTLLYEKEELVIQTSVSVGKDVAVTQEAYNEDPRMREMDRLFFVDVCKPHALLDPPAPTKKKEQPAVHHIDDLELELDCGDRSILVGLPDAGRAIRVKDAKIALRRFSFLATLVEMSLLLGDKELHDNELFWEIGIPQGSVVVLKEKENESRKRRASLDTLNHEVLRPARRLRSNDTSRASSP